MYYTILNYGEDRFEEKRSEFIGYAKRVETEDEAKAFVTEIKLMHKQATHNTYAYIIGENMGIQRYSDDGEPQGTAGIPILEVIKKKGVTNIAVVVTRYFGGVLLGAGGLVRAYSKGAAIAIDAGNIVEKVKGIPLHIIISYELLGKIQYLCSENSWHIEDTLYTDQVELIIYAETHLVQVMKDKVTEATNGKGIFKEEKDQYYFKKEGRLYIES
ncbi:YigZ family protein [Clostridium cellulovorans]|uniref:Uncharacterized protein family UPF0029, Impact, N-terminal n=1 Tax=Clostridium cellulovorans (strain ATCC 35296 / DSM 3052 / OCM 3 / 743B) TaxID=573061 RepID=D9SN45_CLOC7|nr:YigZ family protein [Clostridium cellulovorans]ADL51911.1 uncharacterized protein family UPF0029, Impact, N-terminal [Clostridium cellulovorans 743B]